MKWLMKNWSKSTIFIAIYTLILLVLFVMKQNFELFLIWVQIPAYFLHQFEEYILPGGFVEFFNKKMLGSKDADYPLEEKASFWINIPIIYIAFPISAILATKVELSFGIWIAYFSVVNAASHVGMVIKHKYNPGFWVSLLINIPVGVYTIWYFASNHMISVSAHIIGLFIAIAVQAIVMIYGFKVLKPKVR